MSRVIAWELNVLGSHGMAAVDYPALLARIASGDLRPDSLIERVVGLEEAATLLPTMDRGAVTGMTMIDPLRRGGGAGVGRSARLEFPESMDAAPVRCQR